MLWLYRMQAHNDISLGKNDPFHQSFSLCVILILSYWQINITVRKGHAPGQLQSAAGRHMR